MRRTGNSGWTWLLVIGLALAGCSTDTPEQRLRESIDELQAAFDSRDAGTIEERLATDFIGPGGLDRDGAGRLARLSFLRYREVGVRLGPLEVRMQGAHARVGFTAALTGGSGGLLPESARLYRVDTGWRLEDGDWRLTSATWEPL